MQLSSPHSDVTQRTFDVGHDFESGTITSIKCVPDEFPTNYLLDEGLGTVELRYRMSEAQDWRVGLTGKSADIRECNYVESKGCFHVTYYGDASDPEGLQSVTLLERFCQEDGALIWTIEIKNGSSGPVEIGDLGLPLLFNTRYVQDNHITYTERVIRHSWVSGDGSFILLTRTNGTPPYLVMTPVPGTRLEYFRAEGGHSGWEGIYTGFIHSKASGDLDQRGSWRLPRTSATLAPRGESGDTIQYAFRFRWAMDYDDARSILVDEGLVDIHAVPGMTIPRDLSAQFSLRFRGTAPEVRAEFPEQTDIVRLEPLDDIHRFRVKFARLGENCLTVRFGENRELFLEYFVTEPLETLIRKRADFIVENQQVRDPDAWYNGVFSLWDMKEEILRKPNDPAGLYPYAVGGSDDPCLCKAPYVAGVNLAWPERRQIEAVEYYLEHFVWGKLQRTDEELPHPFGIYGTDNWFVNRFSEVGYNSGGNGQEHLWRTFDYPHLIMLYFVMARIAEYYSEMVSYLDSHEYLRRAHGTAMAFFTVPYNIKMGKPFFIRGWADWAYKQGNFHELVIPDLIEALDRAGMAGEASSLREEWEKKVTYFIYDHPYPYGSEMFFDSTGFESTHMIAKYGLSNKIPDGAGRWYDKNHDRWYEHGEIKQEDFRSFMDNEINANIAARGWLETSYYQLGSDLRQDGNSDYLLSYMTQMGGWSILDYALHYSSTPAPYLRLGYASFLAAWALMNTGDRSSAYGFWYPGQANDGAAGWGFKAEQYGGTWMGRGGGLAQGRGAWRYDGEIDNGFIGAIGAAATVVANDPVFGLTCYGGEVTAMDGVTSVVLKDGMRQRLYLLHRTPHLHLLLDRDGFAADTAVNVEDRSGKVKFRLENRYLQPHETTLRISGLPTTSSVAYVDGVKQAVPEPTDDGLVFRLSIGMESNYEIVIAPQ